MCRWQISNATDFRKLMVQAEISRPACKRKVQEPWPSLDPGMAR
jgi:hypothetical protein